MRTCALLVLGTLTVVACGEETTDKYPPAKCRFASCEEEPADSNPCEGSGTWEVFTDEAPALPDNSSTWCPTDCVPPVEGDYPWEKAYGCGSHFRLASPTVSPAWTLTYLWENPGGSTGHHDMVCADVASDFSAGECALDVTCTFVDSPCEINGVAWPPYGVEYHLSADLRRQPTFAYYATLTYHAGEECGGWCMFGGEAKTWTFTPAGGDAP